MVFDENLSKTVFRIILFHRPKLNHFIRFVKKNTHTTYVFKWKKLVVLFSIASFGQTCLFLKLVTGAIVKPIVNKFS